MGHPGRTRRGTRAGEREWPQRRAFGSRRIYYGAAPAALGGREKRKVTTGYVRVHRHGARVLVSSGGTTPRHGIARQPAYKRFAVTRSQFPEPVRRRDCLSWRRGML